MNSPDSRPHILLVTRNLPPLTGGMERLLWNTALGISERASLSVIGPKGCSKHLPEGIVTREVSEKLIPFLLLSIFHAIPLCRRTKFDVVIGGSGLAAPTIVFLEIFYGCKSMIYVHGLDLVVDSWLYQRLFLPCIRRVKTVVANSRNTRDIAIERGIDKSRLKIVNPGVYLPTREELGDSTRFRSAHNLPFEHFLVFAGRLTKRKGLSVFLQHIFPLILERAPELGLVVIGQEPQHSLNKLGEEAAVRNAVLENNLEGKVTFVGKLSDANLLLGFAAATAHVFPLLEVAGDIEGFGMVAIEAAACGTPTVAFDAGGVADAVSPMNGHLVEAGDYETFAERVLQIAETGLPDSRSCQEHAANFEWDIYNEYFWQALSTLVQAEENTDDVES